MKLNYLFSITLLSVGSVYGIIDNNENGMSDVWERKYQMVDALPLLDPDLDGQNNLLESIAGTDPNDIESVLAIEYSEYQSDSVLVAWQSTLGVSYQLQSSSSLQTLDWVNEGGIIVGTGGMMTEACADSGLPACFYRVMALNDYSPMVGAAVAAINHDTDGDGLSDISEIALGFNPFDTHSSWKTPSISLGANMILEWPSVTGKSYRIESQSTTLGSVWEPEGQPYPGTGGLIRAILVRSDSAQRNYRVKAEDVDTDGDGLSDWGELQVGLDPKRAKTDTLGQGDLLVMHELLTADNLVAVKAQAAVANITRMENGAFELTRTGGLDVLNVAYTVSGTAVAGSDYVSLGGSVSIPFGENSVIIPITPLASSSMSLSESVIFTLQDTATYDLGPQDSQQINVIKEVAINVLDYGAVGDGVTDDTVAIQQALAALELSSTHNTLYIPVGTYRLDTTYPDTYTATSERHILKFGTSDFPMVGRDIIFSADLGAKLYSTVSPVRAHMLIMRATFRSLTAHGLIWEKDENPLESVPTGSEPSGADGVSLVARGIGIVEHVNFKNCQFLNCHGALMVTGNGYDRRGHLRQLGFYDCQLLNPFGSNTINGGTAWGGGQQTYLSHWVGDAIFARNVFEGGGADMTDVSTSPGGRLKDAAIIGGPMRLIFTDNIVRTMGVEAVFHTGKENWMSQTLETVVIPADNGVSTASVWMMDVPTTFIEGQRIIIRTQTTPTVAGANNIFRVVSYDSETRILTFANDGYTSNVPPGNVIPRRADVYLDDSAVRNLSIVHDNLLEGGFPPGSDSTGYNVGITMNTRTSVRRNVILNWSVGIMAYDQKLPNPGSRGLTIRDNTIVTRNTTGGLPFKVHGIRSWAPDQEIHGNTIFLSETESVLGVSVYGEGSLVKANRVIGMDIIRHDYTAFKRSVGLAVGNTATDTTFDGNYTYGMDVGLGPASPSQSIPHRVISHNSVNDTLPVDPRGVIVE